MADHAEKRPKPSAEDRRRIRAGAPADLPVRDADIEPQRGIRYVARIFKTIAVLLLVVMVAEVILGFTAPVGERPSSGAILGEAVRMLAFAGLLWGGADLSLVLIKSHYDLRATRILMQRQNHLLQKAFRSSSGAGQSQPDKNQPRPPTP